MRVKHFLFFLAALLGGDFIFSQLKNNKNTSVVLKMCLKVNTNQTKDLIFKIYFSKYFKLFDQLAE